MVLAAAQVSAAVFLVIDQEFPSIRNAQRYITFLMRMGFNQDQIKVVVNRYTKKVTANQASLEQIQQTLNQPVFYGIPASPAVIASINKARPVRGQPRAGGRTGPHLPRLRGQGDRQRRRAAADGRPMAKTA